MKKLIKFSIAIILIIFVIFLIIMIPSFNKKSEDTDKLYLSIRPIDFANGLPLVYQKLNDDLIIVLKSTDSPNSSNLPESSQTNNGRVLEITGATSYVLKNDISKYGKSESDLFRIALENFDKLGMELDAVSDGEKVTMILSKWKNTNKYGEDVVQSHLLSEPSLNLLKDQLGDEFYVRMSNYEAFIAISKNISKKDWDVAKNISIEDYKNLPHPLSDKLFLYSNGKLTSVEDVYPN